MNLARTMTALDEDSSPQSPDFDLFLISDDDDCFSFNEEMSDAAQQSSTPPCNDVESSLFEVDDSEITILLDYFDYEDDILSDSEYNSIKSEDLWENDWSSQSTPNLEQSETSTQPDSPPPTTQPPEFDQLENLPHEIVERPRCFP
jgi:hypothetical protein